MAKTDIMTAGSAGGEVSQGAEAEQVVQLKLSELHPFEGHPFQVRDDEAEEYQGSACEEVPYGAPGDPGLQSRCVRCLCAGEYGKGDHAREFGVFQ